MFDFSLIYLEFDTTVGAKLMRIKGNIELTDKEKTLLKINAFPESASNLCSETPHFFTFTIYDYFCYTIYNSIFDENSIRNYHQFSIVIITKCSYFSLYKSLLISSMSFYDRSVNELFDVLYSLLQIWNKGLTSIKTDSFELPLFNGSIKFSRTGNLLQSHVNHALDTSVKIGNHLKNNNKQFNYVSKYIENPYFIGNDSILDTLGN
ncbi:hypothetical protein TRFO_30064 [Tritrichomonas foetus]|uniref:UDENN domain-containing protein n=1 Tax=Tritrichomonas foetus TaxID=1144522 RepID=A0A1J4JWD4_9EUKA|nr:hypothetical protein TRFO_30064 [Tritrichomonas foetus]|eukprot:OHT02752.1 hypothetical protein TRFO_30064 [Tritrichomonas foetus]